MVTTARPHTRSTGTSHATAGNARWRKLSDRPGRVPMWTRAEDNDIMLAIDDHVTIGQLAIDLGRPADQVVRRAEQLTRQRAASPAVQEGPSFSRPAGSALPSPTGRGDGGEG